MSKAVMRAGKLYDYQRVLKSCFNAYILSSLKYCAPVWISLAESHLGLLDSIVRSVERLCESELCCLGHRRTVSAVCLLYKIYRRVDNPMNEYLNLVAAHNVRASAALGEVASVAKLVNSVSHFYLLLGACETCCSRACLAMAP